MDLFTSHRAVGKEQTSLNILCLQKRVFFQDSLSRLTCREHPQDVLYRNPHTPDDGLPAEDFWVDLNPRQQFGFHHTSSPLLFLPQIPFDGSSFRSFSQTRINSGDQVVQSNMLAVRYILATISSSFYHPPQHPFAFR